MVIKILFFFCLLTAQFLEAAPVVDASVDPADHPSHFPIPGVITITHHKEEIIDPESFQMNNQPLNVTFVKDVKMSASSEMLVTIYDFQLPAQEKGKYYLPTISVKIGYRRYSSTPFSYTVADTVPVSGQSSVAKPSQASVVFGLEAFVQGPATLYPGERTKLVYRISFNRSVDLTNSVLPMIHPAHFQKVGDVHIRDYQVDETTLQDLTQEVEASELGTFSLGPSSIEGRAYTIQEGQKIYESSLLKATAPVVTLAVKPFPQSAQPLSFNGAIGQIQVQSSLISPSSIKVDETLELQVKIQGVTNLNELRLPRLECQPGFSGFFQVPSLPPLAEVKDAEKLFQLELRPLTSLMKQIPSIEFSSFDPAKGQYIIRQTAPIPITVAHHREEGVFSSSMPPLGLIPIVTHWPAPFLAHLEVLEEGNSQENLSSFNPRGENIFWILPLSAILLLLQLHWKREWEKRPKPQIPKSENLYRQALKKENFQLLEQAFWNRLWEKGRVPPKSVQLEELASVGLMPVQDFIFQLQMWQYGLEKGKSFGEVKEKAKRLMELI